MESSPAADQTSYDEVPYHSHPFPQTHPDRLATVATLLGLKPPRVERCRVLELGCAAGGNVIPMALTLPHSQFVGIDLSRVQIEEGQQTVQALGLRNIELKQLNIVDIGPDFGKFDYIVCHGVYSWVPEQVQDKILDICLKNLTPHGLAYISYNTYPGWHMRGMIRDMLSYHAANFLGATMKVKQVRNLLDFLARAVAREQSPYSFLLKGELDAFHRSSDSYLFHEHLEKDNAPVYFYQFAERAAAKGLRYVGEADLRVMVPGNYPPEIQSVLQMLAQDQIHLEQYMDFLRNRMFRQTLLCHKNAVPNYNLRPEQLKPFFVASAARPLSEKSDIASDQVEKFQTADGLVLNAGDPLVKAIMSTLCSRWPVPIAFKELAEECWEKLSQVRAKLAAVPAAISLQGVEEPPQTTAPSPVLAWGTEPAPNQEQALTLESVMHGLGQALLNFYATASTSLLELSLQPAKFTSQPGDRPRASPLARRQAEQQNHVTNLRHETVLLSDFERHILKHLDGTMDQAQLLPILEKLVREDELQVEKEAQPVRDGPALRETLADALKEAWPLLAKKALIMET